MAAPCLAEVVNYRNEGGGSPAGKAEEPERLDWWADIDVLTGRISSRGKASSTTWPCPAHSANYFTGAP